MYDTLDADITIYNTYYNKTSKADEWHSTQIQNVSWYGKQETTVGESGLNTADDYSVRLPLASIPESFVMPEEYQRLADAKEDVRGRCTCRTGDIVVKGLVDDVIEKPSDITSKYPCFVITGSSDNRRGPEAMQHIRIRGK